MRFDDSLSTVLASDMAPGMGARSAWRQLVDLVGRGRVRADDAILARLRELRGTVPEPVRAASARSLAPAVAAASLVAFFAEDVHAVSAPLLREVRVAPGEWETLLPRLTPALRAILRNRTDLPDAAVRGLDGFGATDFALEAPAAAASAEAAPPAAAPGILAHEAPSQIAPLTAPLGPTPFQPLGEIARGLPLVAEALARHGAAPSDPAFPIPELVARIEEFQRARADAPPAPDADDGRDQAFVAADADAFTFSADANGVVVAVDGAPPGPLVGLSLAHAGRQGAGQVDAAVAGAFRRRSGFADARLEMGAAGPVAGSWRLTAAPDFDPATGRFAGYHGHARRPRADQSATPSTRARADTLRQLVHELRTPANAITGFAELIEAELMGPVPPRQRRIAAAICGRAADLVAAIDDLDTAARIEGRALDLRPIEVEAAALVRGAIDGLAPLLALRGARIVLAHAPDAARFRGDAVALDRLVSRLLAVVAGSAAGREDVAVDLAESGGAVTVTLARPAAWAGLDEAALLSMEADGDDQGAPLLGTGFCLRLARNLAAELGGTLLIGPAALTLALPSAHQHAVEQATIL